MTTLLETLRKNRFAERLETGKVYPSVETFFEAVVLPLMPEVNAILQWHDLIRRYVEQPKPTLFVRLYRDDKKKPFLKNRGGFYTVDPDGFGYLFTDNTLPQVTFALALNELVPAFDDLTKMVRERALPVTFQSTKSENQLRAFPCDAKINPGLNSCGFKLCHIHRMGRGVDGVRWRSLFPRGERDDWKSVGRARVLTETIPFESRERMIAHHVRLMHPANHFLAPGTKWHTVKDVKDIGEHPALLHLVLQEYHGRWPKVMEWLETKGRVDSIPIVPLDAEIRTHERRLSEAQAKAPTNAEPRAAAVNQTPIFPNLNSTLRLVAAGTASIIVEKRAKFNIDKKVEAKFAANPNATSYVLVIEPVNPESAYEIGAYVIPKNEALEFIGRLRVRSPKFEKNGWTQSVPPPECNRWFSRLPDLNRELLKALIDT